jgi:glycine cleavage system H protein
VNVPDDLRYTNSHEWVRMDADGNATVGITDHAQDRLGDLVYVENPPVGAVFERGKECAVVESVKAAADIYAPVSGEVLAVNAELGGNPEKINQGAYDAWLFKLAPSKPEELDGLLDAAAYRALVAAEEH